MAVKHQCDRCGEQFDDPERLGTLTMPTISYNDRDLIAPILAKDLCVRCMMRVRDALKPPAKDMKDLNAHTR